MRGPLESLEETGDPIHGVGGTSDPVGSLDLHFHVEDSSVVFFDDETFDATFFRQGYPCLSFRSNMNVGIEPSDLDESCFRVYCEFGDINIRDGSSIGTRVRKVLCHFIFDACETRSSKVMEDEEVSGIPYETVQVLHAWRRREVFLR